MTNMKKQAIHRKLFLLMLVAFSSFYNIKAQTDSLQYSEEIQEDSMVQYLTPLEYAFMMHEETPWMIKANLVLFNSFDVFNSSIIYEHHVDKGFSLSGGIGFKMKNANAYNKIQLYGLLESRWYYNMLKRVKAGKAKMNLSGNYIAIGTEYKLEFSEYDFSLDPNDVTRNVYSSIMSIYTKWGLQRRFLKDGYVDFGVNTGIDFYLDGERTPRYLISTYINAGFVIANDKETIILNKDKLCSVLRCYASDRFLLKANLIGVFSVGIVNEELSYSFNPQIAAEFKIGTSPFSLNAEVRINSRYGNYLYSNNNSYFGIYSGLEGRWYYNLKKRMLKGKTGNGLSANYIATGISNNFRKYKYDYDDDQFDYNTQGNELGIHLVTGIQRIYAKHVYFDVNLGLTLYQYSENKSFDPFISGTGLIAIGYRF